MQILHNVCVLYKNDAFYSKRIPSRVMRTNCTFFDAEEHCDYSARILAVAYVVLSAGRREMRARDAN